MKGMPYVSGIERQIERVKGSTGITSRVSLTPKEKGKE